MLGSLKQEGQAILVVDKYVKKLIGLANKAAFLERGNILHSTESNAGMCGLVLIK